MKVKKGDTVQLQVPVKDASGNPLPQSPFVLSPGDGYTRQGEQNIAGSADSTRSAVVNCGHSPSDPATRSGRLRG